MKNNRQIIKNFFDDVKENNATALAAILVNDNAAICANGDNKTVAALLTKAFLQCAEQSGENPAKFVAQIAGGVLLECDDFDKNVTDFCTEFDHAVAIARMVRKIAEDDRNAL